MLELYDASDEELADLVGEAALLHCRILLDFFFPIPDPRPGDLIAFEYFEGHEPAAIFDDDFANERLGIPPRVLKGALNRRLAHMSTARFRDQRKPNWNRALTGMRQLFVIFADWLEVDRREWFEPAYEIAKVRLP